MIGQLAQAIRQAGWAPLLRAYAARRRRLDPARVYAADERLVERLFITSGRNLAVAAGFLSAEVRREARVAFLICRTLDAFEDLSANPQAAQRGIQAVVDYIVHDGPQPPSTADLVARDEDEAVEIRIAAKLPLLRDELRGQSAAGRERVHALVTDMADAMQDFVHKERRQDRCGAAEYGERVLGRAARYALQLTGLHCPWRIDYGAIGRVSQAANLLRDAEQDSKAWRSGARRDPDEARLRAVLEALEASPAVPGTLAALRGPAISGARAAVSYVAGATACFYVTRLGLPRPRWLSRPLLAAMCSLVSRGAYLAFCQRLDDLILDLVIGAGPGCGRDAHDVPRADAARPAASRSRLKQLFESWLAMQHPVEARALALHRVSALAHVVIATCDVFPPQSIAERKPSQQTANAIMILDYLLACAVRDVSIFGNSALTEFCELISRLASRAAVGGESRDRDGDIAAFLAAVVARARGLPGEEATRWIEAQRAIAQGLQRLDEHGGFLQRRRAARMIPRISRA